MTTRNYERSNCSQIEFISSKIQAVQRSNKKQTMVGVAQLVEPRIVIPVVVGSSPIVHPNSPCGRIGVIGIGAN